MASLLVSRNSLILSIRMICSGFANANSANLMTIFATAAYEFLFSLTSPTS